MVQVNGKHLGSFTIKLSVRQSCFLSPLLYIVALEPLLCRLRNEKANPALIGVPFFGCVQARVSALANAITVFMSHRSDIEAVKKALTRHKQMTGAKVNFDTSENLRLGTWRGGFPLPEPFRWSEGPVRIFGVWFGSDLQREQNWLKVQRHERRWLPGFEGTCL